MGQGGRSAQGSDGDGAGREAVAVQKARVWCVPQGESQGVQTGRRPAGTQSHRPGGRDQRAPSDRDAGDWSFQLMSFTCLYSFSCQ